MGDGAPAKTVEVLQQRVKRQESLLQRCKEAIRAHEEQCTLLTSEKEALQEQLEERLQELEKMKVKERMSVVYHSPVTVEPQAPARPAPPPEGRPFLLRPRGEGPRVPWESTVDCPFDTSCVFFSY